MNKFIFSCNIQGRFTREIKVPFFADSAVGSWALVTDGGWDERECGMREFQLLRCCCWAEYLLGERQSWGLDKSGKFIA